MNLKIYYSKQVYGNPYLKHTEKPYKCTNWKLLVFILCKNSKDLFLMHEYFNIVNFYDTYQSLSLKN